MKGRTEADRLRSEIRDGTFGQQPAAEAPTSTLTLEAFGAEFLRLFSQAPAVRGLARRKGTAGAKTSWRNDAAMLRRIVAYVPPGARKPSGHVYHRKGHVEGFLNALRGVGTAASTRSVIYSYSIH